MSAERWQQIQEIFERAADLPRDSQRTAVEDWVEDDPGLVADVLKLLQADARELPMLDQMDKSLEGAAAMLLELEPLASVVQERIGPYRLVKLLGEGGMGVVYLAERTDIGSLVAIKLLRDAWFSASRRERFATEQRMLAQLNHSGIARIYDSGSLADATPWFVMEYVAGATLTDYWHGQNGSVQECLRLFCRVCDAVQHAHEHAIIHRDLKPSNILVGANGEVKLLDFGIAKRLDLDEERDGATAKRTIAALSLMTPAYCAPEQLMGGAVGVYTDVYALGVLLYEMLTARLPFPSEREDEMGPPRRTVEEVRERPSIVRKKYEGESSENDMAQPVHATKAEWADLDAICMNALRRLPKERYRSVDAIIRDVDAFLEGRPLEARPDGVRYKLGKFIGRHRVGLIWAVVLLLFATASGVYFAVTITRARNAALAEAARTERIQTFMLNLFGNGESEAGPSQDLKVTSLLDRGVQDASALQADGETQADLYATLGSMYNRLSKYDKADQVLSLALEKRKQLDGPDSLKVAAVLAEIGVLRGDESKFDEARTYVEQAAAIVKENNLPVNDPVNTEVTLSLGRVAAQGGDPKKAIDILTPIAALKPPYGEEQAYQVRDSLTALCTAELAVQQLDSAKSSCQRAIEMDRQMLGDSHLQTGVDLINLASVQLTLRQIPEAEKLYRDGIKIISAWYGADNLDVIMAKGLLARALIAENKNAETQTMLQEVLHGQESVYGPVHYRIAYTLNSLGEIAFKAGDWHEAEADYGRAVAVARSVLPEKDVYASMYQSNLANIYLKESKYADANAILRGVVEVQSQLPPGNVLIATSRFRWGKALEGLHRYPEAEEQLTQAYHLLKASPHPQSGQLRDASDELLKLYGLSNQPQKAKTLEAELVAPKPSS